MFDRNEFSRVYDSMIEARAHAHAVTTRSLNKWSKTDYETSAHIRGAIENCMEKIGYYLDRPPVVE